MTRDELLNGYDERHTLFGLFFSFGNRLQAAGDSFYTEITCKQFFLLICLGLFKNNPPTINELSEVMGSSHQNVKQMVLKLEKNNLVKTYVDPVDKRKIRIEPTEKVAKMGEQYKENQIQFMNKLYQDVTEEEIAITLKTISKIERNLIEHKQDQSV